MTEAKTEINTKQDVFMGMLENFLQLSTEEQFYVGGIVQGMYLQKTNEGEVKV